MDLSLISSHLRQKSSHLHWSQVPGCSGFHLWLSDDFEATWRWCERRLGCTGLAPPYWAAAWPGGQAIARFIGENPGLVAGRRLMDLGCGSGLCAVAAALAGAARVQAVDTDPLACEIAAVNASENGLSLDVVCADPTLMGETDAEVILAGDLWYERFVAQRISGWLQGQARRGAYVLMGDMGRAFFPRRRLKLLASYPIADHQGLEQASQVSGSVYALGAHPKA